MPQPKERWVYLGCGNVRTNYCPEDGDEPGPGPEPSHPCNTAGLADSYKLALSWQPAFCETHKDKPECGVDDPEAYQAGNFTLHGLWPNKKSCGTRYDFCGSYTKTQRPFCKYSPVPMNAETFDTLGEIMPSAAHGSCLQRHEWHKHGTCQEEWDANRYYETAIRLVKEFNERQMSDFMKERIGQSVSTHDFFDAIDQAFGENAHLRMKLGYKNGNLVDIYINLPASIPEDSSIADLMHQAPEDFGSNCGNRFEIDAIGF